MKKSEALTVKDIELEMITGNILPSRLGELRVVLGAKYSQATDEYEAILLKKPSIWNEMRKDYKSDTATERAWEATELGQAERHWKFQLRKIERMMTSLKMMWEIVNTEARNMI